MLKRVVGGTKIPLGPIGGFWNSLPSALFDWIVSTMRGKYSGDNQSIVVRPFVSSLLFFDNDVALLVVDNDEDNIIVLV